MTGIELVTVALDESEGAPPNTAGREDQGVAASGHALFATVMGVCGLAWCGPAIVAAQLPEPAVAGGPGATARRMLHGVRIRRPRAAAIQVVHVGQLPGHAASAMLGIAGLLAGRVEVQPGLDALVLDWAGVGDFQKRVYELTRAIAPGQTRSYGELARALGDIHWARAVGRALGANPFAPIIPCHRVLAANGGSGGFSGASGVVSKLRMLQLEGVCFGGTKPLFEY